MGVVHLPEHVTQLILRQIAEGRAASEADFVTEAVQRYAQALEPDHEDIGQPADEGIADIEAGRSESITGPTDFARLQKELCTTLDQLATRTGAASAFEGFRLVARARRDLDKVLTYSLDTYGRDAAARYQLLLITAMEDIGDQPLLVGSRPVAGKPRIRSYAISHSRAHLRRQHRVQNPAHQLVYRVATDGAVDILVTVGDSYPPTNT